MFVQSFTRIRWICKLSSRAYSKDTMAVSYLKSLNKGQFKNFIDSFDVVLSDCDGVLWRETEVIKGAPETVAKLRQIGKKLVYVTNNNSKTRTELAAKCNSLSFEATQDEVISASYLVAAYLKKQNFNKKVYIVGSEGIARELDHFGIRHFGVGQDAPAADADELDPILNFKRDPEVGAVVIGWDLHFSYQKLLKAATYAHDPNIQFIGAIPDVDRPSPNENIFPGEGCIVKCIEAAAHREAVIVGKPNPFVSEIIQQKYGINPSRTLMIGDNNNTDILLGKRCGFKTLLVLSGVTTPKDLENLQNNSTVLPDFYTDQLSDLLECLRTSS